MSAGDNSKSRQDLAAIRARLSSGRGPAAWRSLDEAANDPAFRAALESEFPAAAADWDDPVGRRRFMKLMGASMALAGVTGCTRQPEEQIVPYVTQPEHLIPGKPVFFATSLTLGGYATGVLVESHMGRPTKIEGNPLHPASLGAAGAITQAAILDLYDPDRAQTVTHLGEITPYSKFLETLEPLSEELLASGGAGLRILTGAITSPTLAAEFKRLATALPLARWHHWEPVNNDAALAGARMLFNRDAEAHYHPDKANVILSLDADFLTWGSSAVPHARAFAGRRRPHGETEMNRLYAVESTPSGTGAMADHRLPLPAHRVESLLRALAHELGLPLPATRLSPELTHWVEVVARDLTAHRGAGLVIPGHGQPDAVHAMAHAINHALGNQGTTVTFTEPVEAEATPHGSSLATLTKDMAAGKVETLFILGTNPVYTAPADLPFMAALEKVPLRVHLSPVFDETSNLCHWHIPAAHELETWGDARAHDGTASLIQPLIAPLYGGRSSVELLAVLQGETRRTAYETVRAHWRQAWGEAGFEARWNRALHDGVIPDSALPHLNLNPTAGWGRRLQGNSGGEGFELILRPDPNLHDGRFANNGWLQELPRPVTKLSWDNAALLSPATAERLGVNNEDMVEISHDGRSLQAPAWIVPGHAQESVTLHLGYGRTRAGQVGTGVGTNGYALRDSRETAFITGVAVHATGGSSSLASTQEHHAMEGRHLVRHASLEEYRQHPEFARHQGHDPAPEMSLYPQAFSYDGHAWGMVVDLNTCTGCNACVVACQAENNIAVVGKDQVRAGREMHWLRIDRYYAGDLDNPETFHQPVMCQHCENAPCEVVCPVAATSHSDEGLNDMTYNRCVGTRYCSNNCPYKVRRFNFFLYSDWQTPSLKLQKNPDVTVRSRGVMEKCTYCVQRISAARIEARKEDRAPADGEITTACQQTCPTGAIVFGDLNDDASRVAVARADERTYGILTDLGTRPRTTYQAVVKNLNPEMKGGHA